MQDLSDDQTSSGKSSRGKTKTATAVQFFLRGLAITLPSVLTLVILLWVGQGIYNYVINPINNLVRGVIANVIEESKLTKDFVTFPARPELRYCGLNYVVTPDEKSNLERLLGIREADPRMPNHLLPEDVSLAGVYVPVGDGKRCVPYAHYQLVAENVSPMEMPRTVTGIYMHYTTHRHFFGLFHISAIAVILTVVLLYFIGRFVTARLGAWFVHKFETMFLARLPVISNIYSSVKQVTDFVFSERTVEYNRVVALEYPRRGIWSIGFVTGDSMLEITAASGEPMVSVLIPSSPMPVTGYTMSVPKSDVLDLDISIDQAFQFCVSCGVLVPEQQKVTTELLKQELAKRLVGTGSALPAATLASSAPSNSPAIEEVSPPKEEPRETGMSS